MYMKYNLTWKLTNEITFNSPELKALKSAYLIACCPWDLFVCKFFTFQIFSRATKVIPTELTQSTFKLEMIVKLDKNIDTFENLQRTTPSSPQLQGQFQPSFDSLKHP